VTDFSAHAAMLDAAWSALAGVDVALIAHGTLPDQAACEASVEIAMREFTTNGTATIAFVGDLGAATAGERQHWR